MNDNLTKIRPGNVKNFEIRCDFCGYTLKGNFVNDIVCRANDLGWKYDYENDRVICRNCQKEGKMASEADGIKNESERRRIEDQIITDAARREAELEPIPEVPAAAKADGVSLRDNWTFEIIDESLIPREYLIPDEVKIRKVVVAMKDKTNIPGVKAINRPIIVKARGV